jgi:hypothetical protein
MDEVIAHIAEILAVTLLSEETITNPLSSLDEVLTTTVFDHETHPLCVVCQSNLGDSGVSLKCKHVFHDECIRPWFNSGHHECPTCRTAVQEYTGNQPNGILISDTVENASGVTVVGYSAVFPELQTYFIWYLPVEPHVNQLVQTAWDRGLLFRVEFGFLVQNGFYLPVGPNFSDAEIFLLKERLTKYI